jgi:hypothetical protein
LFVEGISNVPQTHDFRTLHSLEILSVLSTTYSLSLRWAFGTVPSGSE